MEFSSSIEINASVNKVWLLASRLEEWPGWMPAIKKIEKVSEGPLSVGSKLNVIAKISRLTITIPMTVVEFVPERSVVMQGKALCTKLTRFYRFEPVNGRTKVTIGGEVSGLLTFLARRAGTAVSAEIAQAAKRVIESSA
jgi:carbon monoxide dehydrogenase subunit G